jgi:hypothetical protein
MQALAWPQGKNTLLTVTVAQDTYQPSPMAGRRMQLGTCVESGHWFMHSKGPKMGLNPNGLKRLNRRSGSTASVPE